MQRFKDILCVVRPGESCQDTLERAAVLTENNQAKLTVVDVIERVTAGIGMPDGGPISAALQAAMISAHEARLLPLIEPYRKRLDFDFRILVGTSFLEIIREVLRHDRDLVIKAADTQDWMDRLFGGNDMHLLRKCPCPVWLIKPRQPAGHRRILAAVDVDNGYPPEEAAAIAALNRQVLEMASSMALAEFAELHIVHVWEAVGESVMRSAFMRLSEAKIADYVEQVQAQREQSLEQLLTEMRTRLGEKSFAYLKPRTHLLRGWARKEIPALAKQIHADLLVMGTVARTGIPGFIIGNTAETILNQIDCSVLAIKPPGFATPVTLEH